MAALNRWLRALLFALIVALVACVTVGVFYRYALGKSLFWSNEVVNFLFVWIVFVGAVVAFHEKKHIALTVLVDRLPPRGGTAMEALASAIVLAFSVFLVVTGVLVVRKTLDVTSEAMRVPVWPLYVCAPLAGLLIGVESAAMLRDRVRAMFAAEAAK
jgi:TRAP-type transport system small permease protein